MPGSTPINHYPYPLDSDDIDVAGDIQRLAEAVDRITGGLTTGGTYAARPGSGTFIGQRYLATDIVAEYVWNGTAWVRISTPAATLLNVFGVDHLYCPAGYLIADGRSITNAQTLYPELWAAFPAANRSGANLFMPDYRGRVVVALDNLGGSDANRMSTLPSTTMGAEGGNVVMDPLSLAPHVHGIDHDHASFNQDNIPQVSVGFVIDSTPSAPSLYLTPAPQSPYGAINVPPFSGVSAAAGSSLPMAPPYKCANVAVKI